MLAPKQDESPVQYWISLWPTAPLFGVKWRFEGMAPAVFNPLDLMHGARAGVEEVAKAAEAQSRAAADALEEALETTREAAEAIVDVATGASQLMADDAGAFVEELDAPEAPAEPAASAEAEPAASAEAEPAASAEAEPAASAEAEDAGVPPLTLFAAPPAQVDDLKQIKGVGPKLEKMLNELGIYRLDQIAAFSPENLIWVDANLTTFKGRPLRDDWVAQAKGLLSSALL
jgi:NADH-quinone oxidoreductase subunit E